MKCVMCFVVYERCAANSGCMIVKDVFVAYKALTERKFTVAACCSDTGVNAHCPEFRSFLSGDVCGQHVWLHPPVTTVERSVKRCCKCKAHDQPCDTSAWVLFLPFASAKWCKLLQDVQLLQSSGKGLMLFAEADHSRVVKALGPSPWDCKVYYNPLQAGPAALSEMSLDAADDAGQLTMSFSAFVAASPACVLADSGAVHDFIDSAHATKLGVQKHAASGVVTPADQRGVPVTRFVRAHVRRQAWTEVIKLYVVDTNLHVVWVRIG